MSQENVELVRRLYAELASEGSTQEFAQRMSDDGLGRFLDPEIEWVPVPESLLSVDSYHGFDGVRRFWGEFLSAWQRYRVETLRFDDAGDRVAVVVHIVGRTHELEVDETRSSLLTVRDGRVVRVESFADPDGARQGMGARGPTPAVAADAAGVLEVVAALETSLYGQSAFSQADLEAEWADIQLERDARVVRDGDRIVGYGVVRERGEVWSVEGYVHPDALGGGIGKLIATGLEEDARRGGARRVQNAIVEADSAAGRLLESLGYGAVRVFRELRIELEAPPPAPEWPDGLRVVPFDPQRDAREFHAAHQEAFADAWDFTPRDFESWSKVHLGGERFDPALWCAVRAGDEIAAGTICRGDTYGGGWVDVLFTRRPWRRQGVGAALLADSFGRFWERGEHSVGLSVDAASATGAFRLYERAGMAGTLGWTVYEKELGEAGELKSG